jgi:hypothetical protein
VLLRRLVLQILVMLFLVMLLEMLLQKMLVTAGAMLVIMVHQAVLVEISTRVASHFLTAVAVAVLVMVAPLIQQMNGMVLV